MIANTLKGIRVLDFSHVQSGPISAMLLGDMGAEVIKVESFSGDQFRAQLDGANFVNFNRNKRGIALDLKKREGKEVVLKLAKKADVLVENFLPGVMDRLGLGYDAIRKLNPRTIYCSISGYGQEGPYRDRPAFDPIIQAMSGIMDTTGEPGRPPVRIRPGLIDHCAGLYTAFGIAVSLIEREKTGVGKRIEVSLLDVAINPMSPYITQYKRTGELPKRAGSALPAASPYQVFEARDGLIYIAANTDLMWANLCKALKLDDLFCDPRYSTVKGRCQNREDLAKALTQVTHKYGCDELESRLLAERVPCGKVRTIGEVVEDAYIESRQILEEVDHPIMGKIVTVKTPIFFSGELACTQLRAPLIGEHTKEILSELGYGDNEIGQLLTEGVALQYEA